MTRGTGVRIAVLFAAGLAVAVSTAQAQDGRAAAREVAAKWQSAVVNVRVVLKMRMSMGGREMQASDDPVDTVGTVIDPSGLTVLSLGALNPGGMMTRLMGSAGGGNGEPNVDITTEPTDVKIRLADGREVPARIVLRDEDLDLVFLRPTKPLDKPLVAVDLQRLGEAGPAGAGAGSDPARSGWRMGARRLASRRQRHHREAADVLRARRRRVRRRDAGVQHQRQDHRPADAAAGRCRPRQHVGDDSAAATRSACSA